MEEKNPLWEVLGVKTTKNKEGKTFSKLILKKEFDPGKSKQPFTFQVMTF